MRCDCCNNILNDNEVDLFDDICFECNDSINDSLQDFDESEFSYGPMTAPFDEDE